MITHETPGKGIGYGMDVFLIESQEIRIIFLLEKDIRAIVSTVVDVVEVSWFYRFNLQLFVIEDLI
jgi:hypothetical protein